VQPWRVRRVDVPPPISASFACSTANDALAFAVTTEAATSRTAPQWARAVFEGAPAVVRWFLLFGWAHVLRLQLGPAASADHALGWAIADGDLVAGSTSLTAESRLVRASNTVVVERSTVTWVTLVHYSHAAGRPLWAVARPFHRLTLRYLLARAAREASAARSPSEHVP
jgi:hypothetical protein